MNEYEFATKAMNNMKFSDNLTYTSMGEKNHMQIFKNVTQVLYDKDRKLMNTAMPNLISKHIYDLGHIGMYGIKTNVNKNGKTINYEELTTFSGYYEQKKEPPKQGISNFRFIALKMRWLKVFVVDKWLDEDGVLINPQVEEPLPDRPFDITAYGILSDVGLIINERK
ncbi:MAG: hypothetical protein H8D80_01520 [Proteobacteria bacterium]|nr:hypothetical protein [Pseudomonadota bacterium]